MKLAGRMALAMPLLFSSLALQPQASAQGRQAATPAPAAQTPAAVPGGRGGRGGVPGPGPAIGGEVDETPVVTHHSITVQGKTINYTATVAQMPLKNAAGETEAHIFYMAYTLDGVTDTARRPLTFCFNGGPGSASMWVHMGGMGPRSPEADAERQHAAAALPDEGQPGYLARSDRPRVHRPRGHRLQPRQDRRDRAPHERRAGRHPVGGRIHAHVHHPQQPPAFAAVHRRARAMARFARPAWRAT